MVQKSKNKSEKQLRVLKTAAAIIREDICSVATDINYYPFTNQMFDNINDKIPNS